MKSKQQQRASVKAKEKSIADRRSNEASKLQRALRNAENERDDAAATLTGVQDETAGRQGEVRSSRARAQEPYARHRLHVKGGP